MALDGLTQLLVNDDGIGFKLIPHVEEAAMRYVTWNTVMAQRVLLKTDMKGWNARKVSEYVRSRRAQTLTEDVAIASTNLVRVRKNTIEPQEVGDLYRISDRRADTDIESIVSDVVQAIGDAIAYRVETDLLSTALDTFKGGVYGDGTADWQLQLVLEAAMQFRSHGRRGALFHVVHPFQVLAELKTLIDYSTANQEAVLAYRDNEASKVAFSSNLNSYNLPFNFGVTNIAISEMLPRRVIYQLRTDATGGTFRLQMGDGHVQGTNITADITYSATIATLLTNIDAAIAALPVAVRGGTWVATGTVVTDITVTPPADVFHAYSDRLRIANKYDTDAVLENDLGVDLMKSFYDELTGVGTDYTDKDGNAMGVVLRERVGSTCKSLMFERNAIIWDVRKGIKANFELVFQGRTAEYAGYMTYGAGDWSPEVGAFIHTKCESPLAVA